MLNSLAVAQPLFDLIGANPPFLIAHRAEVIDVLVLVATLLLGVPILGLLVEALAGVVGGTFQRALHRFSMVALVTLALYPVLVRSIDAPEAVTIGGGVVGGVGFVLLHRSSTTLRELLRFMAPVPIVFAAIFLSAESVRPLMARSENPALEAPRRAEAPIVFLLLDELPLYALLNQELEVDAELFPSFARLASDSIWLRNATAVHPLTTIAVPSILNGRRARRSFEGSLRGSKEQNLFTWLGSSHRLVVREKITALCPPEACEELVAPVAPGVRIQTLLRDAAVVWGHSALPRSVAGTLPSVDTRWADFAGAIEPTEEGEVFRALISSVDGGSRPTLYFLHLLVPHVPWFGLPTGLTYPQGRAGATLGLEDMPDVFRRHLATRPPRKGPLLGGRERSLEPWPAKLAFQRHLLQVGYVDSLLGELLDRLEETGIYDRALIVVTSDHGVAFQPGEHRRRVVDANLRDIVHVPLFVKPPFSREPLIDDRNVESMDILPTMADALGIEIPDWVDGQSALDDSAPRRPTKIVVDRKREHEIDARLPTTWYGLRLKNELFGPHPSWDDVYALSSRPALLGRRADAVAAEARSDLSYRLLFPEWFADVDPESGRFPAYVPGIVKATEAAALPEEVALAVNGVIRGVGRTFARVSDTAAFAMMLPPDAFRAGENRVEIFALDGQARLRPIAAGHWPAVRPDSYGLPNR